MVLADWENLANELLKRNITAGMFKIGFNSIDILGFILIILDSFDKVSFYTHHAEENIFDKVVLLVKGIHFSKLFFILSELLKIIA